MRDLLNAAAVWLVVICAMAMNVSAYASPTTLTP